VNGWCVISELRIDVVASAADVDGGHSSFLWWMRHCDV